MKKPLLFFILTLLPLAANATAQDGDIIFIEGAKWELLGNAINLEMRNRLKAALPEKRSWSSTNWDGYTLHWSIRQDALHLDSVTYEMYDKSKKESWQESLSQDSLRLIFKDFLDGETIVASWFTGELRLAQGKVIHYVHSGYESHFEKEMFIGFHRGKMMSKKDFHNKIIAEDGLNFEILSHKYGNKWNIKDFFPIDVKKYPELAGAKRIIFKIDKARVDSLGNLVECQLRATVRYEKSENKNVPKLAEDMAEMMMAKRPWRTYFINGEYRALGIEKWNFPYPIAE